MAASITNRSRVRATPHASLVMLYLKWSSANKILPAEKKILMFFEQWLTYTMDVKPWKVLEGHTPLASSSLKGAAVCMCVCMCVCARVQICVYVQICVWKSEDSLGCQLSPPTLLETGSLGCHLLHIYLTSRPSSVQRLSCVYLPSTSRTTDAPVTRLALTLVLGVPAQVLLLA